MHKPAKFLFTFRLLLFSRSFSLIFYLEFVLFLRQGRGICWYIELYILFFLSFLYVYHVHSCVFSSFFSFFFFLSFFFLLSFFVCFVFCCCCFFSSFFSPFFFSLFVFCIYYEFIFAEDLCVLLPLLLISLSFSGGFLVKEVFLLF